eukprot:COSAG02_NODE_2960_length_7651_cov_6.331435_2_plen_888_part_00
MVVSDKADIWGLGVTSLYLMSGQPPLEVGEGDDLVEQLATIGELQQSDVEAALRKAGVKPGAEFESFLLGCLQVEPAQRLSAQALLGKGYITTNSSTQALRDGGAAIQKVAEKLDAVAEDVREIKEVAKKILAGVTFIERTVVKISDKFEKLTVETNDFGEVGLCVPPQDAIRLPDMKEKVDKHQVELKAEWNRVQEECQDDHDAKLAKLLTMIDRQGFCDIDKLRGIFSVEVPDDPSEVTFEMLHGWVEQSLRDPKSVSLRSVERVDAEDMYSSSHEMIDQAKRDPAIVDHFSEEVVNAIDITHGPVVEMLPHGSKFDEPAAMSFELGDTRIDELPEGAVLMAFRKEDPDSPWAALADDESFEVDTATGRVTAQLRSFSVLGLALISVASKYAVPMLASKVAGVVAPVLAAKVSGAVASKITCVVASKVVEKVAVAIGNKVVDAFAGEDLARLRSMKLSQLKNCARENGVAEGKLMAVDDDHDTKDDIKDAVIRLILAARASEPDALDESMDGTSADLSSIYSSTDFEEGVPGSPTPPIAVAPVVVDDDEARLRRALELSRREIANGCAFEPAPEPALEPAPEPLSKSLWKVAHPDGNDINVRRSPDIDDRGPLDHRGRIGSVHAAIEETEEWIKIGEGRWLPKKWLTPATEDELTAYLVEDARSVWKVAHPDGNNINVRRSPDIDDRGPESDRGGGDGLMHAAIEETEEWVKIGEGRWLPKKWLTPTTQDELFATLRKQEAERLAKAEHDEHVKARHACAWAEAKKYERGVKLSGWKPPSSLNTNLKPMDGKKMNGYPLYDADIVQLGKLKLQKGGARHNVKMYYHPSSEQWMVNAKFTNDKAKKGSANAKIKSPTGALPLGRQVWDVWSEGRWKRLYRTLAPVT